MIIKEGYIYKIIYPNGKIYIGQDRTNDINYFGSANGALIERDFSSKQMRDFTIRKQIIFEFRNMEISEINRIECEYIRKYKSNDPSIGYNRYPGMKRLERKKQTILP